MEIKYLQRSEIDKVKWNSCVHYANNGNIFGYIWFLDQVAKDWDALVEGDYESVMPLVWRKGFWKSRELYQPDLMRELGIYSIHVLSPKRINHFLDAIPQEFRLVDVVFNEQNIVPENTSFSINERTNYQLWLDRSYEALADQYSKDLLQKLDQASEAELIPSSSLKPEKIADFYRKYAPAQAGKARNFHALQRIMYNVLHRGWGFASGVMDRSQKLQAVNFFIYSHGKIMSLVPVVSPEGQESGALEMLTDLIIRTHAGRPVLFDFNTEEEAFATSFGALPNTYMNIRKDKRLLGIF